MLEKHGPLYLNTRLFMRTFLIFKDLKDFFLRTGFSHCSEDISTCKDIMMDTKLLHKHVS